MLLTTRQSAILRYLLETSIPESAGFIANELGLSPRMLRHDLLTIERWLNGRKVVLVKKPNYGVFLDASAARRQQLIEELEHLTSQRLVVGAKERLQVLILKLLTVSEPLLVKQLALELQVSHATILKDLDQAEVWLQECRISMIRKPNFGILATGDEIDMRQALVNLLVDACGPNALLSYSLGTAASLRAVMRGERVLLRCVSACLDQLDLRYCRRLVTSLSAGLGCQFIDDSCVSLVIHLALMAEGVRCGRCVTFDTKRTSVLKQEVGYALARLTADRVERHYRIKVPEGEVAFLMTQLSAASIRRSVGDVLQGGIGSANSEALQLADQIVAEASLCLHPYLKVDQQLRRALAFHLEPILHRLRSNITVRNPLLNDMREKYPHVVTAAGQSCRAIEKQLGMAIPPEEVGYVAMHLGAAMERLWAFSPKKRAAVICAERSATASLLVSQLQAQCPAIEIVHVLSVFETEQSRTWSDVDLVISTSPLALQNVPVVVVSPLLEAGDLIKLRKFLSVERAAGQSDQMVDDCVGPSLAALLIPATIRVKASASTWPQVVKLAGQLLLASGAADATYIKAMEALILSHGPYVVLLPGIALLHARPEDGARKLGMAVMTLKTPVAFGHPAHDPVDIAIAFTAIDRYSHVKALTQLVQLVRDQSVARAIREASTADELLNLMRQGCDG